MAAMRPEGRGRGTCALVRLLPPLVLLAVLGLAALPT
jgi:hypothetical protein